jgi:hypothetical protein
VERRGRRGTGRFAARALRLAAGLAPSALGAATDRLDRPAPTGRDEMRLAAALTSRMVGYLAGGRSGSMARSA